jgi:hypothetical protein
VTHQEHIDELREIARGLEGRLSQSLVDDAMEYVGFNELGLAIETLCDHLYEHDVPLLDEEVRRLTALTLAVGTDPRRVACLGAPHPRIGR